MAEYHYPVHKYNDNITRFLGKVKSANIFSAIASGLKNETIFIDKGKHISYYAHIEDLCDGNHQVVLSSAFCQYFWLICDVALKILDRNIIAVACVESHISLDDFKKSVEQTNRMTKEQIMPFLPYYIRNEIDRYLDYIKIVPDLLDAEFWAKLGHEIALAESLSNKNLPIDKDAFDKLDMNGRYSERTCSVYCYGVAFMMLHELAHHQLNHFDKDEEMEDEKQADYKAFKEIYTDITGDERFSAHCGILCLFAVLMLLNPKRKTDGIHPREDARLFAVYDEIVKENPKYTVLLVSLLDFWAKIAKIDDYPKDLPADESSIQKIREYFQAHQ